MSVFTGEDVAAMDRRCSVNNMNSHIQKSVTPQSNFWGGQVGTSGFDSFSAPPPAPNYPIGQHATSNFAYPPTENSSSYISPGGYSASLYGYPPSPQPLYTEPYPTPSFSHPPADTAFSNNSPGANNPAPQDWNSPAPQPLPAGQHPTPNYAHPQAGYSSSNFSRGGYSAAQYAYPPSTYPTAVYPPGPPPPLPPAAAGNSTCGAQQQSSLEDSTINWFAPLEVGASPTPPASGGAADAAPPQKSSALSMEEQVRTLLAQAAGVQACREWMQRRDALQAQFNAAEKAKKYSECAKLGKSRLAMEAESTTLVLSVEDYKTLAGRHTTLMNALSTACDEKLKVHDYDALETLAQLLESLQALDAAELVFADCAIRVSQDSATRNSIVNDPVCNS